MTMGQSNVWDLIQGNGQHKRSRRRHAKCALTVATANGTTWSTLFTYVRGLDKSILVVLGQEHRLWDDQIDDASLSALKSGWETFFSRSIPTDNSTSSGVVIFVRSFVECWYDGPSSEVVRGRGCTAVVNVGLWTVFMM